MSTVIQVEGSATLYFTKSQSDNHKETHTQVSQEIDFTTEILFAEGYPNIDAYAVESYGLNLNSIMDESDLPDMGQNEAFVNEYEVTIDFDTQEDLQDMAETMASERPEDTVEDWIENFKEWKETRTDRIEYLQNKLETDR